MAPIRCILSWLFFFAVKLHLISMLSHLSTVIVFCKNRINLIIFLAQSFHLNLATVDYGTLICVANFCSLTYAAWTCHSSHTESHGSSHTESHDSSHTESHGHDNLPRCSGAQCVRLVGSGTSSAIGRVHAPHRLLSWRTCELQAGRHHHGQNGSTEITNIRKRQLITCLFGFCLWPITTKGSSCRPSLFWDNEQNSL